MGITICYKRDMETPLSRALEYLLRTTKGATQKKVAKYVGISQPYVSDLKKGDREGTLETWEKIAEYFKKTYTELYQFGETIRPTVLSTTLPPLEMTATATTTPPPDTCPSCGKIKDIQEAIEERHSIVIQGFKDKERATRINEMLVKIESP